MMKSGGERSADRGHGGRLFRVRAAEGYSLHGIANGERRSYLLATGGRSILFEGACASIASLCRREGLPAPEAALHTFLKDEFCLSDHAVPGIVSHVPAGLEYIATRDSSRKLPVPTARQALEEWAEKRGEEPYGILGCITLPCLERPLPNVTAMAAGDVIRWQGFEIGVLATPSHGKHSVSLCLCEEGGAPIALFTGGLIRDGSCMVNYYDAEWEYGLQKGLRATLASLDAIREIGRGCPICPAYGPVIEGGPTQIAALSGKIRALLDHTESRVNSEPLRIVKGRKIADNYADLGDGICMMSSGGNVIVFLDEEGEAIMVDPGPCYLKRPDDLKGDMEFFESKLGLKKISLILVTHIHGDHMDGVPFVRDRYGASVKAPALVADVIRRPRDYNLPSLLPAYGLGLEGVPVDEVLDLDRDYSWKGVPYSAFWLPGHCCNHVGYLIRWKGRKIACTGDFLFAGERISPNVVVVHSHCDEGEAGYPKGISNLIRQDADLILTAHSTAFVPRRKDLAEFREWIERRRRLFQALAGKKDLREFMLPERFR